MAGGPASPVRRPSTRRRLQRSPRAGRAEVVEAAGGCASPRGRWDRGAPGSLRRGRGGGSSSLHRSERSVGSSEAFRGLAVRGARAIVRPPRTGEKGLSKRKTCIFRQVLGG